MYVLIEAESWGWGSGRTLGGFAAAALLIAAFVLIERRHQNPLIPLRIFSNRSLAAADVTMMLVAAALFGVFFFCTLYLQQVLGYDALKTGLAYLPMSASLIVASGVASRLVDRFTPKPVLASGLLVSTAGLLLLTRLSVDGDYVGHVLPATVVLGIGLGMCFVPVTIAGTSGVAARGLRARVRAAQHDAASRRIAGLGDPRHRSRHPAPTTRWRRGRRCRRRSPTASRVRSLPLPASACWPSWLWWRPCLDAPGGPRMAKSSWLRCRLRAARPPRTADTWLASPPSVAG